MTTPPPVNRAARQALAFGAWGLIACVLLVLVIQLTHSPPH